VGSQSSPQKLPQEPARVVFWVQLFRDTDLTQAVHYSVLNFTSDTSECVGSSIFAWYNSNFTMSGTVIDASEWNRIIASVGPETKNDARLKRKEELKKMSSDKYQNWPNTLDALRQKKLNFVAQKAEQEELARQEVDREEAERRRKERLASIKRANDLMYAQTDKMKSLKGAKLYSEVVLTRQGQMLEKQARKEEEKEVSAAFHQTILQKVRIGQAEEDTKAAKLAAKVDIIKVQRAEQVAEVQAKRAQEQAEAHAIGEAMKKRAQERLEEVMVKEREKQERIAAANIATMKANERAKVVKMELAAVEAQATETRLQEKEQIDGRVLALKALEKRRFEKKQQTRQKMIDKAVELLANQEAVGDKLEQKQGEEIRAKEDAAIQDKADKRERERLAIIKSRTEQIAAKEERRKKQWDEEDRLVAAQRERSRVEQEKEQEKHRREHENLRRLKAIQYSDAAKHQRKLIEERVVAIEQSKLLQDVGTQDDDKFANICRAEILRFTAEGKPTYTLLKAMEQTAVPLLAAKLDTSKRGKGLVKG